MISIGFFDNLHSDFSHFCHHEIFCEYTESSIKISDYSVKGRLKHALEFWETSIQPNNDILNCSSSLFDTKGFKPFIIF
jgi:hypothetical protein